MKYLLQNRTKIAGLISSLLVIASFVLFFIDFAGFVTDNEIDTFLIGLLCLALSLFFAIIGLVNGNNESLGHTLCFPSVGFSFIALIIFCILTFANADNNRMEKESAEDAPHKIDRILSSDYLYQYEREIGENAKSTDFEPASTLFALCQAYGFFSDEERKPNPALLMSLAQGFKFTLREENSGRYTSNFNVKEYFQGCEEDLYEFYTLYSNELYEILCIKSDKHEDKYFIRENFYGFVKHVEDVVLGYEETIAMEKMTNFEKEIAYTYEVFRICEYELYNPNLLEDLPPIHDDIVSLGYDWGSFINDVAKEKAKKSVETEIRLYNMMKNTFNKYTDISDYTIARYAACLNNCFVKELL